MDHVLDSFSSGVHNLLDPEIIPKDAAQDAKNFITRDGRTVLVGGRALVGAAGAVGGMTGFHRGYTPQGTNVFYRKAGTVIEYYDGSAWQTSISGLTENAEYSFANYSSLSGSYTYVNGVDGYWKIINVHPANPIDVYNAAKNFKGYIIIDRGRTLLWNRDKDKTGLYGSWIDAQDSTVYTTVSAEAIGVSGSTNYTGTLAFKAGGSTRSCFGVSFVATVAAGTETFVDNLDGTLTSNFAGTGTINYATGAYNITFSDTTTGNVTSDYQWEDSNIKGVSDFSYSTTRVPGEGFVFPQDEGGDAILNVLIGQDGNYYSMKSNSAYVLALDADDVGASNQVYRKEMGLPFWRAALSTNKGIFFINTVNPTKPIMTILRRSTVSNTVEPKELFPHFKFSNYNYSECAMGTYDRWVLVFCKTLTADNNDTILMCDIDGKTVDIIAYSGKQSLQNGSSLYVSDSVTRSVYSTFDGFDDLGNAIIAHWTGKDELLRTENLKKFRKLRFKGFIDPDQYVGIWMNIDDSGFSKIGTIRGDGSYVNYNDSQAIGAHYIGESQIGGDAVSTAYGYYMEIKVKPGKFRKISLKIIPEGIGYFDFDTEMLWDVLIFESRVPKVYRSKQDVSIDGTQTDQ